MFPWYLWHNHTYTHTHTYTSSYITVPVQISCVMCLLYHINICCTVCYTLTQYLYCCVSVVCSSVVQYGAQTGVYCSEPQSVSAVTPPKVISGRKNDARLGRHFSTNSVLFGICWWNVYSDTYVFCTVFALYNIISCPSVWYLWYIQPYSTQKGPPGQKNDARLGRHFFGEALLSAWYLY